MQLVRIATAFLLVFGLLGVLYAYSRRKKPGYAGWQSLFPSFGTVLSRSARPKRSATPPLDVLRRISLTPTHKLHLISTTAGQLLVCTHPNGCTVLNSSPAAEGEASRGEHFYSLVHDHA
ncbi:MAG: hypothetical protein JOZ62_24205 [Acidobacteriaceae bacterium]|nr:hypothetical protein [Acidobacteriaceae bacterium]